ncbi:hypothetical protein [Lysinibacillus sphaericus]|uniref:hypothetical protein n=1 Tax=Lysinibacillus sphaericus TaxID=1421 RepID=UPI0018CD6281|nr:hypothetical protein [Lysinibacillus sphaericus]
MLFEQRKHILLSNKAFAAYSAIMVALLGFQNTAFAESKYDGNTLKNSTDDLGRVSVEHTPGSIPTVEVPNVTINQAQDFVERKGFDIVELLQIAAQPISIVMFIIGAIIAVVGSAGKTGAVMKGIIVMVIAVIVYAATMDAPTLVDFGNKWLKE